MDKRRYKGFDYHARDPKPEQGDQVDTIDPLKEELDADRNPEAGIEVGGEAQGIEGESKEPSHDLGEGESEPEG